MELKDAEDAIEFLRKTGVDVQPLAKQARLKTHMLKYVEALTIKSMANQGISVSLQKDYARADDKWLEAAEEDAEAFSEWTALQERRDTARTTISLYQTMVKDRL